MDDFVTSAKRGDNILALKGLTKDGIPRIEIMLSAKAEIELGTRRIGIHGAGHGKRAVIMAIAGVGIELPLDAITGSTGSRHTIGARKPQPALPSYRAYWGLHLESRNREHSDGT